MVLMKLSIYSRIKGKIKAILNKRDNQITIELIDDYGEILDIIIITVSASKRKLLIM
jgi:hypothetical protein